MVFDKKTGTNILQWPVKEVESLRSRSYEINDVELKPGSLVPLKISSAAQVHKCIVYVIPKVLILYNVSLFVILIIIMTLTCFFVNVIIQLDIIASFEVDEEAFKGTFEADGSYNCSASAGAAGRGILGPFGILVLADDPLSELTPVYFYIAKGVDGSSKTYFCADQSRFACL